MPSQPATASTAPPPPTGDTYTDLNRACHRWLMERNPGYRKSYEAQAAHRTSRKARNQSAGEPARQTITED